MLIASCPFDRTMAATMQRKYAHTLFVVPSCISSNPLVYRCLSTTRNTPDVPQPQRREPSLKRLGYNLKRGDTILAKMTGKRLFQLRCKFETHRRGIPSTILL